MECHHQAAWIIRKTFHMSKYWLNQNMSCQVIKNGKFHIAAAYKIQRGNVNNVDWKHLICHNAPEPKQVFILWIALYEKMRTKDRLRR